MLKENFKVAVPEFPDRKTSITAYGAVKNVYDDDTGRIIAFFTLVKIFSPTNGIHLSTSHQ